MDGVGQDSSPAAGVHARLSFPRVSPAVKTECAFCAVAKRSRAIFSNLLLLRSRGDKHRLQDLIAHFLHRHR